MLNLMFYFLTSHLYESLLVIEILLDYGFTVIFGAHKFLYVIVIEVLSFPTAGYLIRTAFFCIFLETPEFAFLAIVTIVTSTGHQKSSIWMYSFEWFLDYLIAIIHLDEMCMTFSFLIDLCCEAGIDHIHDSLFRCNNYAKLSVFCLLEEKGRQLEGRGLWRVRLK